MTHGSASIFSDWRPSAPSIQVCNWFAPVIVVCMIQEQLLWCFNLVTVHSLKPYLYLDVELAVWRQGSPAMITFQKLGGMRPKKVYFYHVALSPEDAHQVRGWSSSLSRGSRKLVIWCTLQSVKPQEEQELPWLSSHSAREGEVEEEKGRGGSGSNNEPSEGMFLLKILVMFSWVLSKLPVSLVRW